MPADKLREKPPEGPVAAAVKRVLGTGEEKIKVKGFDDLMVFRARCCNPIRGEKIVGYITRGKGVSVHSATCPERRQPALRPGAAHRRRMGQGRRRLALHREADDGGGGSEGLLAAVSAEDRRTSTPTSRTWKRAPTKASTRAIDVTIEISDLKHLEKVIESLKGVEGVLGVERAGRAGS